MDMLEEEDDRPPRTEEDQEVDENDLRNAMRNKRDWEIFIGSLPSNADERELEDFFRSKKIRIANIRIPRNEQGESKCVAFGLCLDAESARRALSLDGERFGSKSLRINKAAKR